MRPVGPSSTLHSMQVWPKDWPARRSHVAAQHARISEADCEGVASTSGRGRIGCIGYRRGLKTPASGTRSSAVGLQTGRRVPVQGTRGRRGQRLAENASRIDISCLPGLASACSSLYKPAPQSKPPPTRTGLTAVGGQSRKDKGLTGRGEIHPGTEDMSGTGFSCCSLGSWACHLAIRPPLNPKMARYISHRQHITSSSRPGRCR